MSCIGHSGHECTSGMIRFQDNSRHDVQATEATARIDPAVLHMRDLPETRFLDYHTDLLRHGSRCKYLWLASMMPRLNTMDDRFEPTCIALSLNLREVEIHDSRKIRTQCGRLYDAACPRRYARYAVERRCPVLVAARNPQRARRRNAGSEAGVDRLHLRA